MMRNPQKKIRLDPFPETCGKDTSWKVANDEITYLLQCHLQFPVMNFLRVLVDIVSKLNREKLSLE